VDELANQLLGGAVALLILKEVFSFISNILAKRGGANVKADAPVAALMEVLEKYRREYFSPISRMTQDLHDWHNVNDQDGVKIWYVRPSLAEAVKELSTNIKQQTKILEELIRMQQEYRQEK
jgi:hypothetical protein